MRISCIIIDKVIHRSFGKVCSSFVDPYVDEDDEMYKVGGCKRSPTENLKAR